MAEQRRIELTSEWLCVGGRSVAPTVPTLGMRGRRADGQTQIKSYQRHGLGPRKFSGLPAGAPPIGAGSKYPHAPGSPSVAS